MPSACKVDLGWCHHVLLNNHDYPKGLDKTVHSSQIPTLHRRIISRGNNSIVLPVISWLTSLMFWLLFHVISIPFCPNTCLGLKFGQTDRFPNTFHFGSTLLSSCVHWKYNSNVTWCLSYLKILHYKVL